MNRERLFSAGVTLFSIIGILLLILLLFSALGYGGPGGGFGPGIGDGDDGDGDGDGDTGDGDHGDGDGDTGITIDGDPGDGDSGDGDLPGDGPGDLPGFHSLSTTNRTHYSVASYDRYTGNGWRKTTDPVFIEAGNRSMGSNDSLVARRTVIGAPVKGGPHPGYLGGVDHHVYPSGDVTPSHPYSAGDAVVFNPRVSLSASDESNISRFMDMRYTHLSDDVPERVVNLSDLITESSSERYDVVEDIVVWINTNKNYSLSPERDLDAGVSEELSERYDIGFDDEEGGGFVDEFLFEMRSGHDMHFASATVVLLRAQGIPARYVVGFEEIDGELRRDTVNHWVEVGFDNKSTLTVYPTSFVYRERHRYTNSSYSVGSSLETTDPIFDEVEAEFLDEPVPGGTVDVRVTRNGRGLSDVYVGLNDRFGHQRGGDYFFDEPPAVTDSSGVASVWVPYDRDVVSVSVAPLESNLEVVSPLEMSISHSVDIDGSVYFSEGVRGDGDVDLGSTVERVAVPTSADIDVDTEPVPGSVSDVDVGVEGVPVDVGDVYLDSRPLVLTDEEGGFSYRVPYRNHELRVERGVVNGSESIEPVLDGDLELVGEPRPLETVTVSLSVRDVPVEHANVSVNNQTIGFTDRNGSLDITVPDDTEFNVTARKGELVESIHVNMTNLYRDMELSFTGVAFPSTKLGARVTSHGDGLRNAELTVNNESLGMVGMGGWHGVSVPIDPRVEELRFDAEAQGYVVSDTREIPLVFRALFMVYPAMGVVFVVFVLIQLALTRGVPSARAVKRKAQELDDMPSYIVGVSRGLIRDIRVYIEDVLERTQGVLASVPGLVESMVFWVADGLVGLVHRLSRVPGVVIGLLWGLVRFVVSAPFRAIGFIRGGFGAGGGSDVSRGDEFDSEGYENRVFMAWAWIAGRVSSSSNLAPLEIASRAIDIGMPERPVLRLTRVFQMVRYGGVDASEELEADAVSSAEKSIEGLED